LDRYPCDFSLDLELIFSEALVSEVDLLDILALSILRDRTWRV
jgi:hypothetical protein